METMTPKERIRLAFIFWLERYNQDKYRDLTMKEKDILIEYNFLQFFEELKNLCHDGDSMIQERNE